jgi:hypothetical protein
MKMTWLANTTSGYMIGDYISASIVGSQAFPGIPVAFAPLKGKLQEFMYTAAMNVAGGSIKVGRERVVVMAHVQKRRATYLTAN